MKANYCPSRCAGPEAKLCCRVKQPETKILHKITFLPSQLYNVCVAFRTWDVVSFQWNKSTSTFWVLLPVRWEYALTHTHTMGSCAIIDLVLFLCTIIDLPFIFLVNYLSFYVSAYCKHIILCICIYQSCWTVWILYDHHMAAQTKLLNFVNT